MYFYCFCFCEAKAVFQKNRAGFYICLIWFGLSFWVAVLKFLCFWYPLHQASRVICFWYPLHQTSRATQAAVLDISKTFSRVGHTGLLYKFRLYVVMKTCFILLGNFVVVTHFEFFWSTSHLLSVPLMLGYLRILFPIFFALNE